MAYILEFSHLAIAQLEEMKKSDIISFKKASKLLAEIIQNPKEGSGNPKTLKGDLEGYWARRINRKDRLVYRINEEIVSVYILSSKGHYFDK